MAGDSFNGRKTNLKTSFTCLQLGLGLNSQPDMGTLSRQEGTGSRNDGQQVSVKHREHWLPQFFWKEKLKIFFSLLVFVFAWF